MRERWRVAVVHFASALLLLASWDRRGRGELCPASPQGSVSPHQCMRPMVEGTDLGHRPIGAFLTTPHLLWLLAFGSLSPDSGSRLAEVFFWISAFRAVDQSPNAVVVSPYACGSFLI